MHDFALNLIRKITVSDTKTFFVSQLVFNPVTNTIFLASREQDVHVLNEFFEPVYNFTLPMDKIISFLTIGFDNLIYFIDFSMNIKQYESNNLTLIDSPCQVTIWCIVDNNGIILSYCFDKYGPKIMYFHSPNGTIYNQLSYETPPLAFLDSKSRLVVALYKEVIIYS